MIRLTAILLVLIVCTHGQSLQDIQNRISQSGRLNAQSLGPKLAGFLGAAFQNSDIPILNISFRLTPTQLTVLCDALVWGGQVHAEVDVLMQDKNDLELAFALSETGPLQQVFKNVSGGKPVPDFVDDLRGTGSWAISFASAAGLPFAKGLTLQGEADIVNGTLIKALHWFQPSVNTLHVSVSLFVPIFSDHPENVVLTLGYNGVLPISKTLVLQSFAMVVNVPANFQISAGLQATLQNPTKGQPNDVLTFQVSGQFTVDQSQVQLLGKMSGTWTHPLGFQWVSISSATCQLNLGNDNTQVFSINAQGSFTFSSAPVALTFSIGGPNFENVLIAAENFPVSKEISEIYTLLTGKSSIALSQVKISGTASVAVATYDTQNYQEGFTIKVNAQVAGGNLLKASRVLRSDAAPTTFNYVGTLFVPIFTQGASDLSLVESGSFPVTKTITCDDFSMDLALSSETSVKITADISVSGKISASGPVKFNVLGDWEETTGDVTFKGTLLSPWTQPYGLTWLIVNSGAVSLTLGNTQDTQLAFQGAAQLAFDIDGPVTISASIGGPSFENAMFSVGGLPIDSMTLDLICYYLLGMSQAPAEIKSLHPTGTAKVTISTFDSSEGKEGFTFEADVTLQDQGDVYKVAKFFQANPSTVTFNLDLYISVFGQTPALEFSVSEQGQFPISSGITINSYSIDVTLAAQSSIAVQSEVAVQFQRQPAPLVFDTSAAWNSGSASLDLSGSMSGSWTHPFGVTWLQINNVAIHMVLGAPTGLQSLSVSGMGNFTFGANSGTSAISVTLANDLSVTLSATITDKWSLQEIAKTILGNSGSALIGDIVPQQGDASLAFTLSSSTGVTVELKGTVTGDLQKELEHVAYWFKQNPGTFTFDIAVGFPLFSGNPAGISIDLALSEEIALSSHFWFESVVFSFATAPAISVGMDVKIKAEFQSNPTLYFEANGAFKEDGSVLLWGAMEGTWKAPFGIPGFALSDVILELGVSPTSCGIGSCISDLGVGVGMTIGNTEIKFDGNAAAPDYWNIFLAGSISNKSPSKTLPVVDVIDTWNGANPNRPVSKSGIPSDWALSGCSFYFAPIDGSFGPIHYTRGFGVTAAMTLLSMDLFVSLNCTDSTGISCNFQFDVHVTLNQFSTMISKEISGMYPNRTVMDIFSLKDVRLAEWSQQNVAGNVKPRWMIDIEVLGTRQHLDFRVEQYELAATFHQFFVNYMKHIFD